MSTEVIFYEEAQFHQAMVDVRSDTNDSKFLVVGHADGNPNRVCLVATGTELDELATHMDPAQCMYALARYEVKFDMSTTVKFVYIHWLGEQVPPTKRGRFGVVHGSVEKFFTPYHNLVDASTIDELDTEIISQRLMEAAGTKSKVLDENSGERRQERGFTQTQLPQRKKVSNYQVPDLPKSGAGVEVDPEVFQALASVRSDTDPSTFVVAGYRDNNPKGPLVCVASGDGCLDEVKAHLDDSQAMYASFRVTHTDTDDITVVKFVYIAWVGSKVKPMTKAKVSTQSGEVQGIFSPMHVKVFATDLSDIDEGDIMQKIKDQGAR